MTKKTIDFEGDAQVDVTDGQLKTVRRLATRQLELEALLEENAKRAEELMTELRIIQNEHLPTAMDEIGIESFSLTTGESVVVKNVIKASITKANEQKAFAWLRKNDLGSIIKNRVVVDFGRDEERDAERLTEHLRKDGRVFERKESVHSNTLSAVVRERIEQARRVPRALLGVFEYRQATIKKPRRTKKG